MSPPHALGERGQISLGDRPHRQEHRWGVARGPVLGPFRSRTEALQAEREWLANYRQFRNGS
jgi:hypothetical protein